MDGDIQRGIITMNIDLGKTQAQIDWLKQKLYLDAVSPTAAQRSVKRGQVYYCELGVGVGSELQKKRPCVIMQNDIGNFHSSVTTVIPITHTGKSLSCFTPITPKYNNGTLILDGYANTAGIRSIDKARIGNYICDLTSAELKDIDKALAVNLDIYKHYLAMENKYNDKLTYIEKLNALLNEIKDVLDVDDNKKIIEAIKKVLDNS